MSRPLPYPTTLTHHNTIDPVLAVLGHFVATNQRGQDVLPIDVFLVDHLIRTLPIRIVGPYSRQKRIGS